ncbi:integrase arm-type DNA-binding domain-containing protein [Hoeflea alexandrii]|uniref:tyrosine-type recombinase/integrase n=1 Tax=Hoeflea alexandrii TaxID=288436 RepID=UPI0035CFCF4E
MARTSNKLTTLKVKNLVSPGRYGDGNGLYLHISSNGGRRWIYRFKMDGREREMGLGGAATTSLAEARDLRDEAQQKVRRGIDPIEERKSEVSVPTFGEAAEAYIAAKQDEWSNPKHRQQWRNTITQHASAILELPVDRIGLDEILRVLKPIWSTTPETAHRLRGRIERILDAAGVKGWRSGDNSARWKGNLDNWLAKPRKLSRGHHAATSSSELPEFMETLRRSSSISALALEFTILTAARTGEVIGATWDEIDLENGVWTVPAERMKANRPHRKPLTPRAMEILQQVRALSGGAFIFPGGKQGRGLSNMAMSNVAKRINPAITVHGFRSTFRDWVSEETDYPRELAEAALAHVVGDATERAYRRGDGLEKRRAMMEAWEVFVSNKASN